MIVSDDFVISCLYTALALCFYSIFHFRNYIRSTLLYDIFEIRKELSKSIVALFSRTSALQKRIASAQDANQNPSYLSLPPKQRLRRLSLAQNWPEPPRQWSVQGTVTDPELEQDSAAQASSLLFTKLPPELRLQIFEDALDLADTTLHIRLDTEDDPRIEHVICRHLVPPKEPCWGTGGRGGGRDYKLHGIIDVLLTCRRMYTEVHPLLYRLPHFKIRNLHGAFQRLSALVPTHHLAYMRHLSILWNIYPPLLPAANIADPHGHSLHARLQYQQLWATIAKMKELKNLNVHLEHSRMTRESWKREEEVWLAPIEAASIASDNLGRVFKLWLPVPREWVSREIPRVQLLNSSKAETLVSYT